MWQRHTQCPLGRPALDEGGRLRVVDEHEIATEVEARGVGAVDREIVVQHGVGEDLLLALERVVERLRHREEVAIALDDLPLRLDAHVVHEGHEASQDLRHPPAHAGGVDVDEVPPADALGDVEEEVHRAPGRDLAIRLDPGAGQAHRATPPVATISASTRASIMRRMRSSPPR